MMGMEYQVNEYEELQQMREQIMTLRSKLEQQQIISQTMILKVIQSRIHQINRWGLVSVVLCGLAIPFCCGIFYLLGYSEGFLIGTGIMLAVCLCATAYTHLSVGIVDLSRKNMIEVGRRVLRMRKQYVYWHLWSLPMMFIWCGFFVREIWMMYDDLYARGGFLVVACIGMLVGGGIGFWTHLRMLRMIDDVLVHMDELRE